MKISKENFTIHAVDLFENYRARRSKMIGEKGKIQNPDKMSKSCIQEQVLRKPFARKKQRYSVRCLKRGSQN
jgi:hypothetical protein